ncbi:uncharacterized protein LOC142574046 [Dermacentor variabilis]|uniref:uncharacterized protein LOC142574046 n=1 Tax=Dermacentor variabilis TaxID=34621 RepID=UPI003F5B8354
MPHKDFLRRKSKRKEQQRADAEAPATTSTPVPPVREEAVEQADDSGQVAPLVEGAEELTSPAQVRHRKYYSWTSKIRATFQKKARPENIPDIPPSVDGEQPGTSFTRAGLIFTRDVVPPDVLLQATKMRRVRALAGLARDRGQSVDADRGELEERRVAEPDPPFNFNFVRDTLLKYERVDDWLKDVLHELRKLVRWKRPFRTGLFLTVALGCIWAGCLLQLLLAPAVVYVIGQSLGASRTGSNKKKTRKSRCIFKVDDVPRILKLDMRVSKTFQAISTAFDKTNSLLSWKNPSTTLCLVLALMALILLAFWQGQGFAVQVTVTLILLKLFVADQLFHRFPEMAASYDLIGRAWDRLPVHPVENSERRKSRG